MCTHDVCSICGVCGHILQTFVGAVVPQLTFNSHAGLTNLRSLWLQVCVHVSITPWHGMGQFLPLPMLAHQDNMIQQVAGLEFLSRLQKLALANNPLTDFKELRRLSHLPDLTELSFKDLNFGVGTRAVGWLSGCECWVTRCMRRRSCWVQELVGDEIAVLMNDSTILRIN